MIALAAGLAVVRSHNSAEPSKLPLTNQRLSELIVKDGAGCVDVRLPSLPTGARIQLLDDASAHAANLEIVAGLTL